MMLSQIKHSKQRVYMKVSNNVSLTFYARKRIFSIFNFMLVGLILVTACATPVVEDSTLPTSPAVKQITLTLAVD
jgi:hypothetical protein